MKYYILVFLIVLVLLFIIFYHESEHIRYYMSCFMNSKNNAGLPTPIHCKNTVSKFISSNVKSKLFYKNTLRFKDLCLKKQVTI